MNHSRIAESLAQLTAGWTSGPAGKPESLENARKALAASLLLGMESSAIHPALQSLPPSTPHPDLTTDLQVLIAGAPELAEPAYFGLVRSLTTLAPNNPPDLPTPPPPLP